MSKNVKCDAAPIPASEPKVEEPLTPPKDRRQGKEEYLSDSSSSDSGSEFSPGGNYSTSRGKPAGTVININKAEDVHIGSRYSYYNTIAATSNNYYTETDNGSHDPPCKGDKGPRLSEELLTSERELNTDDMYTVAENISRSWKKLARFLPPKNVFTEGQLKTFEDNNLKDQEEAVFEMLTTWKKKCPKYATVGILAKTLWDIGKGDIARMLHP